MLIQVKSFCWKERGKKVAIIIFNISILDFSLINNSDNNNNNNNNNNNTTIFRGLTYFSISLIWHASSLFTNQWKDFSLKRLYTSICKDVSVLVRYELI